MLAAPFSQFIEYIHRFYLVIRPPLPLRNSCLAVFLAQDYKLEPQYVRLNPTYMGLVINQGLNRYLLINSYIERSCFAAP